MLSVLALFILSCFVSLHFEVKNLNQYPDSLEKRSSITDGVYISLRLCCQTQELNSNGLEEGESMRMGWDEIKNCTLPKKDLDPEAEDPGSF